MKAFLFSQQLAVGSWQLAVGSWLSASLGATHFDFARGDALWFARDRASASLEEGLRLRSAQGFG